MKKIIMVVLAIIILALIVLGIIFILNKNNDVKNNEVEEGNVEKENTLNDIENSSFYLEIEDTFTISDRGTVVTGEVKKGEVSLGNKVMLKTNSGKIKEVEITGLEIFKKTTDTAVIGENVALLLKDVSKDEVRAGDFLYKK